MEEHYRRWIEAVGEDPDRQGLAGTPRRAARALEFLTSGYGGSPAEVVGSAVFASPRDDMVIIRDIEVYSLCEHHLLPFIGRCHVGYLPQGRIMGLSKVARIVDLFARAGFTEIGRAGTRRHVMRLSFE